MQHDSLYQSRPSATSVAVAGDMGGFFRDGKSIGLILCGSVLGVARESRGSEG